MISSSRSLALLRGVFGAVSLSLLLVWVVNKGGDAVGRSQPVKVEIPALKVQKLIQAEKRGRTTAEGQKHAWDDLLAGKPFTLVADGRPQRFTLSLSELHLAAGPADQRLQKFAPLADARQLLKKASGAGSATLVLYPEGREGEPAARHFLNQRILVQTTDRSATLASLSQHGLRLLSEPDYAPGSLIVEPMAAGPEATLRALAGLMAVPGVRSVSPLLGRHRQKHFIPNDPFFTQQWFLKNTGQSGGKIGTDMRVENVWNTYKGSGVRIAIVDDGLDLLHPDLAPNVDSANHYDWNDFVPDTDPTPKLNSDPDEEDTHGTAVAGVAAARGHNGTGVSGVAPEAKLVGFRLISSQDADGTTDEDDADAMSRGKDVIDIKNCSWGTGAPAWATIAAGPLMEAARENATATGRGGKGTIFVWSSGNGRLAGQQGQKDGSTNSMFITTVGGVDNKGNLAGYSEGGSHLVVSAPTSGLSGTLDIVTTDLRGASGYNRNSSSSGEPSDRNYTSSFGGTSSAAPAVSGAVALMLQANPNLGWRDVKEIFLRSSVQLFPTGVGWVTRDGGDPSLPLIKHHELYGGGLIDTQSAVSMAESWVNLGPMISAERTDAITRFIPDNNTTGITATFDFSALGPMRVEHAKLRLNVRHNWRGDLEVTLRSPSGIASTLATEEFEDDGEDYIDWDFSSVRHWGEVGTGSWTLNVRDLSSGISGTFQSATLTLYGTDVGPLPQITTHSTGPYLLRTGDPLTLTAAGTGGGKLAYIWSRNGTRVGGNTQTLQVPSVNTALAGNYRVTLSNGGGSDASGDIPVAVVGPMPLGATVKQNDTLNLSASAAGPGLTYLWKHDGQPLTNGAKPGGGLISGADATHLSITNMQEPDQGTYTCVIGHTGLVETLETNATTVTVFLRPVLDVPTFGNHVRGSAVTLQVTAQNNPTTFTATGLPAGVLFNRTTGALTGRPTKPGSYILTITATNANGSSAPVQHPWIIEEFPTAAVGVWQGVIDRNAVLNQSLGGRFKITVTTTGSYSGSLTLGTLSRSWTGFVNAQAGSVDPVIPLSIPLTTGASPATGSVTLDLSEGTFAGSFSDPRPTSLTHFTGVKQAWSSSRKPVTTVTVFNSALELPGGLVGQADYPQGTGFTTHSLSTSGSVTWGGRLADGTTLTGSTPLGPTGQTSLHSLLYTNTGSIQGWAQIDLATFLTTGTLDGFKAPQKPTSTTRSYKGGIPQHFLNLRGARYTKPSPGNLILGLTSPTSTTSTAPNARLLFTKAPLNSPLTQLLQITALNAVKMPTGTSLNPQAVRLTLSSTTGLLSGGFTLKDLDPLDTLPPIATLTRTATYHGLLITRPDLTQGVGFFTLFDLADEVGEKNTTTPALSGRVDLLPPEE